MVPLRRVLTRARLAQLVEYFLSYSSWSPWTVTRTLCVLAFFWAEGCYETVVQHLLCVCVFFFNGCTQNFFRALWHSCSNTLCKLDDIVGKAMFPDVRVWAAC